MQRLAGTSMPFLYPSFELFCGSHAQTLSTLHNSARSPLYTGLGKLSASNGSGRLFARSRRRRELSTATTNLSALTPRPAADLNPPSDDFSSSVFADKCSLVVHTGSGGNGCVSFLRDKLMADGPANGGDGGTGGSVYIQAVDGETSLHKVARMRIVRAGRGKHGKGRSQGGKRGDDVLLQVPVGTVVREVSRHDPVAIEEEQQALRAGGVLGPEETGEKKSAHTGRKWILSPASAPSDFAESDFPAHPLPKRSNLAGLQPPAPIRLDLSENMAQPILLAAGAVGGLGNPNFATNATPRPKFATKGDEGMRLELELELKLLADLGFVGMPNAGKSTLLRAVSRSRARVGDWAFTTLQPNIGTVVLDDHRGRPRLSAVDADGAPRTHFYVADIPGLVPDAHLDRGLGLDFLRHVERAKVLAFVVDLGAGSAVEALKTLWRELVEFEKLKEAELHRNSQTRIVDWKAFGSAVHVSTSGSSSSSSSSGGTPARAEDRQVARGNNEQPATIYRAVEPLPALTLPPISSKPWFVVASKADLEHTQDNFEELGRYLADVSSGSVPHPTGRRTCWKGRLRAIPVSAVRGEGVEQVATQTISLLGS